MKMDNKETPKTREKPEGTKLQGRIDRLGQTTIRPQQEKKEPPKRGRPRKPKPNQD